MPSLPCLTPPLSPHTLSDAPDTLTQELLDHLWCSLEHRPQLLGALGPLDLVVFVSVALHTHDARHALEVRREVMAGQDGGAHGAIERGRFVLRIGPVNSLDTTGTDCTIEK